MKKRNLITGIILIALAISIFAFSLTNHLIELKDMKECANTPGCMYCIPTWVGGTAYILYFVSFVLLAISIFCFIKVKRDKRKIN